MRRVILIIFVLFLFIIPRSVFAQTQKTQYQRAVIVDQNVKTVTVILPGSNTRIMVPKETVARKERVVPYKTGDSIYIASVTVAGKRTYYIADIDRTGSLWGLFALFVFLAFLVGGKRGVLSLVGMVISFVVILVFLLPGLIAGVDPVMITILASALIIPFTFFLSHGISKKTLAGIIGSIISLIIIGILSALYIVSVRLSGLASEESAFLQVMHSGSIDMRGLLLAGIIVGSLGVLDDITISQSSIVFELKKTDRTLDWFSLYKKAMNVGRDHISSMINTLILVYAGSSLPLLLLFVNIQQPLPFLISTELVAEEIVRTLTGSIGLICAVPITTLIAALMAE